MNYLYGKVRPGPGACRLGMLQEVEDDYELLRGVSRKDDFPDEAHFRMSDDFPKNLLLEDVLFNINGVLVVSDKFKDIVNGQFREGNEILPVRIVNHKNVDVGAPYYIIHQVDLQECLDLERSEYEENQIDPEQIAFVDRMVLDEARIRPDLAIFRMKRFTEVPIFRRDAAEVIKEAGISGFRFKEIDEWE